MLKLSLAALAVAGCVLMGCGAPAAGSPAVKKITVTTNGKTAVIALNDSPVAAELYGRLPLTVEFSDYNDTEKIAYLPEEIHRNYRPSGHKPAPGDLCLYAPWGNLSLFYRAFPYTSDLFYLGRVERGMEFLTERDSFTAVLERAE